MSRCLASIIAGFLLAACEARTEHHPPNMAPPGAVSMRAADESGAKRALGRVFSGRVVISQNVVSGGMAEVDRGTATASLTSRTSSEALFVLDGRSGHGRFRLDVPGRFERDGTWHGRDTAVSMTIDRDGRISGSGSDGHTTLALAGRIGDTELDLDIAVQPLQGASPSRELRMRYHLQVEHPTAPQAASSDAGALGDASNCKRVEWKLKVVANPSGGPMQTVRVPVCVH